MVCILSKHNNTFNSLIILLYVYLHICLLMYVCVFVCLFIYYYIPLSSDVHIFLQVLTQPRSQSERHLAGKYGIYFRLVEIS